MAETVLHIAICDDDAAQREYLSALVAKWQRATKVSEYASAEEFLFSGFERTDILLLDVQMPGMNGYEATKAIRALGIGIGIPVFALTASSQEADKGLALQAGMNAFLPKQ